MTRLHPIEKPDSLYMRIVFTVIKKQFGKVLQPFRYIYARSLPIFKVTYKIIRTEKKLSINEKFVRMIRFYTSHVNDCSFCSDFSSYNALKDSDVFKEWKHFSDFRNSEKFSEQEKAILAYVDEINMTKTASTETFQNLQKFFSDKEIVEITWVNATEGFFNLMAKPLALKSDDLASQTWQGQSQR